jgi:lantibiotic modifying enzyme
MTPCARLPSAALLLLLTAAASGRPLDPGRRDDCLTLARQAADHVLAHRDELEGPAVYAGKAGAAQFLLDLGAISGEVRWTREGLALLEAALAEDPKGDPGLYTGLSGVGQVCLEAWRRTGKKAWLESARDCAGRLGPPRATDVISGSAGVGFFLLNLHASTGEKRWLGVAKSLGDRLEALAIREDGTTRWPIAKGSPRVYTGFSHGAAGIGTFFVHLHRATGDRRHRKLAEEAARFLLVCAKPDGEGGYVWSKLHPTPEKPSLAVQWCHGSPGIGLFFLALRDAFGRDVDEKALRACVEANRRTGRTARRTGIQCHGVAGNAELFVEAWRSRADPTLLATAREWAGDLLDETGRLRTAFGRWSYGPGYMTGIAGIGRYALRLAAPKRLGLPFMPSPADYRSTDSR